MATFNIANMGVTSNSISVRAYYGGTASERNALYCQFYCDGSYFGNDTHVGSKNWTTTTVTKTGLSPNILYSFYAIFYDSGYAEIGRTQTISIRTDSVGEPTPLPPSSVTVSSITSNSVTVSHGTVSGANAYMLYREYNGMDIHIDTHTHPSSIFYVTGLMANTTYRMGVSSVNTNGESSVRWSSYFTTLADLPPLYGPSISLSSKTSTSATITLSSSGATSYELEYKLSTSSTWITYWDDIYNPIIVTGLQSGKIYNFRARAYRSADGVYSSYSSTITVDIGHVRPDNWVKWTSIASGASFYGYANGGKTVYLMPATEWNEFIEKINGFRLYKGLSQITFTQASSNSDATITQINQAIDSINPMVGNALIPISSDGDIKASTFINMKTKLNSIS